MYRLATGIIPRLLIAAPVVSISALYLWTRRCYFEPFSPGENGLLFAHPILKVINPRENPTSPSCCVRAVPFAKIRGRLLEDAREGGSLLIEAFCAGLWGGRGFFFERSIMRMLFIKRESHGGDLWSAAQLLHSTYEPGTVIANIFIVLDKNPSSMRLRGCFNPTAATTSPVVLHSLDNLFELSFDLDEEKQQVEFRLRTITFDGATTKPKVDPYGGILGLFHRMYAPVLVESAVSNCTV